MSQTVPVITSAGLAALLSRDQSGFSATITHVGVGLAGYTPNSSVASLQDEVGRWPIIDGENINESQLYLYAQITNDGADPSLLDEDGGFWIREIGFYLEDGTLFAVHSVGPEGKPVAYKSDTTILDIDYQIVLDAVPAGSVTVINTGIRFNPEMTAMMANIITALGSSTIRYIETIDALSDLKNSHNQEVLKREARIEQVIEDREIQIGALKAEIQEKDYDQMTQNAGFLGLSGGLHIENMKMEQRFDSFLSRKLIN